MFVYFIYCLFQGLKKPLKIKILPQKSRHNHRTIIRTGITCKKIPSYMRDSACRWFIVKKAKMFCSYVKHFLNSRGCEKM